MLVTLHATSKHHIKSDLDCSGLISRHPHTPETHALHYTGPVETPAAVVSLHACDSCMLPPSITSSQIWTAQV